MSSLLRNHLSTPSPYLFFYPQTLFHILSTQAHTPTSDQKLATNLFLPTTMQRHLPTHLLFPLPLTPIIPMDEACALRNPRRCWKRMRGTSGDELGGMAGVGGMNGQRTVLIQGGSVQTDELRQLGEGRIISGTRPRNGGQRGSHQWDVMILLV